MKQTNNAIKFLMAQYRAIFQNAYFKGLATAAVVTMGLAAGQAQAGSTDTALEADEISNLTGTVEITGGSETGANNKWKNITISAADADLTLNANVVISGGTVDANKINLATGATANKSLTIQNLTIATGNVTDGLTISGTKDKGEMTVKANAVAVETGTLKLALDNNKVGNLEADSITVGKEANSGNPVTFAEVDPTAVISVAAGSTLGKANTTVYTLYKGGQITLAGDDAKLLGKSLASDGGKLVVKGDVAFVTPTVGAEKLDIAVDAEKTLTVKLPANGTERGVAHFASGSTINLAAAKDNKGTLAISGDTTSGSLVILDSGVNLTSTGDALTTGGVISVTGVAASALGTAELQTDADVLGKFLVGSTEAPKATKGGVLLDANSKLTISNKKVVLGATATSNETSALNLLVKSGTAAAAGQLTIKAATTLEANEVAVVNKLDGGTNLADKLDIVTDKLTLGAADFDSDANKFGFQSASAKSELNFVSKTSGNTLKLQDTVTLHNVDSDNKALAGKITGDVNLASTLTIKGGNYTYNDNITIGSSASNKLEVKTEAGVDKASLVLGGSLLVDRTNASQVTASGTDSGEAFIDLSDATIEFTGKSEANAITFEADKNATIKIGADNIQELVKDSTKKGAIFSVANGGTLLVGGDLTLADASTQLKNTGVTNSGIQLANGTVAIDGTLTLKKADSVSLGASDATTTKLKAQVLSLEDKTPDTATELKSGTFAVTQTLNTNSNKGFTLGAQGVLELGVLTEVTPKTGDKYFEAVGGGSVNQALEVSGADSAVKVLTGNWNGTDLTVKQQDGLVIGQKAAKNSKGELISANLTVNKLDVQAESGSTINKGSSLTTTEVALSTGTVVVDGDLSINGKYTAEDTKAGTPASYGLAFKDNSVVLNEGASLTLGADVNYALGIAPDATKINAITPVDTIFLDAGVVSGGAFSNVSITLGEGVSLTTEAITQLEKALFGTDGTSGTISIGQATIADLPYDKTASTEDTPVLNWKDVKNDSGLMAVLPKVEDEKLKSALIKADQNDTLLGNIGSIQTNGFTGSKVNIGGNGSLNSADVVKGQANKLFAYNDKGEVLGLDIKPGVNFKLVNGGEAGDVSLGANSQLMIDGGASNGKTVLASLSGKTSEKVIVAGDLDVKGKLELNNVESKAGTTLNVDKNASFAGISTLAGNTLVKGNLSATKNFTSTGSLQVSGTSTFDGETKLAGNNTLLGDVAFNAKTTLEGQNTLGATTFQVSSSVAQGQTFAKEIKLGTSSVELSVGKDAVENTLPNGSTANLVADKLTLAGGTLYADPTFNLPRTIVVAGELTQLDPADKDTDAGTLDGKAVALRNSIIALGVDTKDADGKDAYQASVDYVKNTFAPLFEAEQSLQSDGIGAIAYVNKKLTMGNGKIVVDPSHGIDGYTCV